MTNGAWASPKTWKTYAYRLCDFFAYLEDNGIAFDEVNKLITAKYREYLLTAGASGKPLSSTTVATYIQCIDAFYRWGLEQGWVSELPFHYKQRRLSKSPVFQPMTRTFIGQINATAPKAKTRAIRIPTQEELRQFVRSLPTWRDRLMVWLGLETGMRLEEIVRFDLRVLPKVRGAEFLSPCTVEVGLDPAIVPTKGSKHRIVEITSRLHFQLRKYSLSPERRKLALRYKQKYRQEPTLLFLSRNAEPMSLSRLDKACQSASARSGIKIHPHLLRHAFATHTLLFRKEVLGGETAARQWLQARMGHCSFETTRLYVHLAQDLERREQRVLDAYQEQLSELMESEAGGDH